MRTLVAMATYSFHILIEFEKWKLEISTVLLGIIDFHFCALVIPGQQSGERL